MTRRSDGFGEFLDRRGNQLIWKIMTAREELLDPHLHPDVIEEFRDRFLEEVNDFLDEARDAHANELVNRTISPELLERLERLAPAPQPELA